MEEERYSTDDIMATMPISMIPFCDEKMLKTMRGILDAAGGSDKGLTGEELDALTDMMQSIGGTNDEEIRQFCRDNGIEYNF